MENAVEGLKMAGSVLLFILALSIAVISFSNARQGIDSVVRYSDRETYTIKGDNRFFYNTGNTNRIVGIDTIIPTLYRAYKENYRVVFEFGDSNKYLFMDKNRNKISKIDLEEQNIASEADSVEFLNGIIYHQYKTGNTEETFKTKFNVFLSNQGIYDVLVTENKSITESFGTYYMEDVGGTKENVEDVNKAVKRVITYTFNT